MSSEWKTLLLGDVYEYCSGLSKPRSEFGSGHPFLGFKDVFYNSAVPKVLNELVRSTQQEQNRCSIKRGDLFLTRTSETMDELGMSSVALKDYPNATFNGFTKRLRPKSSDVIAPEYARYYFRSTHFRQSVNAMSTMSTRASLNNEILDRLQVVLPPLKEQKCIGYLLATLDDKIELNRKTNETLEAMAKALFKSWFVDFNPVRAKAEGRPTGLPAEISDLFPDSFEDSELGEIPSGWSIAALSDIAHISTGKRPESVADSRSSANHIPVYGGAGIMGYTCSALIDGGPILATGRVGTLGVVNRVLEKAWISDNTLIINPGKTSFVYVYHYLLRQDLKSLNRGSTQPLLSQTELKSLPIATPPRSLLSTFCELTQHWQERQTSLIKDNVNTKALLDALLPKLISGEIRIPDAERMLEEVGV